MPAKRTIKKICRQCDVEFWVTKQRKAQKHCSRECSAESQRISPLPFVCRTCKETFYIMPGRAKRLPPQYCSYKCRGDCQRAYPGLEERFWENIDRTRAHGPKGDCWVWTGGSQPYGKLSLGPGQGNEKAHRVSWMLHFGEIPKDQWVLHRCDNPTCVRPDHLFLGDNTANQRDRHAKGRFATKVSAEDIEAMRAMRRAGKPYSIIGAAFGISHQYSRELLTGEARRMMLLPAAPIEFDSLGLS